MLLADERSGRRDRDTQVQSSFVRGHAEDEATWPDTRPPETGRHRSTWVGVIGAMAVVIVLAVLVSLFTGVPGPGAIRRFPLPALNSTQDRLNAEWRAGHEGRVASVDLIRSRVRVEDVVVWCSLVAISPSARQMIESNAQPPGGVACPAA